MNKIDMLAQNTFAESRFDEVTTNIGSLPKIKKNIPLDSKHTKTINGLENTETDVIKHKTEVPNLIIDKNSQSVQSTIEKDNELQDIDLITLTAEGDKQYLLTANEVETNYEKSGSSLSTSQELAKQPWWVTNSIESESSNFVPWLLGGIAGIGAIALASGNKNDGTKTNTTSNTPTSNPKIDKLEPTLIDESIKPQTISPNVLIDSKPDKPATITDSAPIIDKPATITDPASIIDKPLPPTFLDTKVSKPIITLDDITGDNSLDNNELAKSTITITGQITGIDADVDSSTTNVLVSVNGKSTKAIVTGNNFSADINSSDLKADSQISAQVTVTDGHENTAMSEAVSKPYSVIIEPVTVSIDSVTINEAQQDLVITGKVSSVTEGQIVEVKISDTTYTAGVNPNGSFSCIVSGLDLERIEDYTVSVQIKGNTNLSPADAYSISEYMSPSIIIKHVENDYHINSNHQLIRLSGAIDFNDTIFEQGANSSCLKSINVEIGDSVYNAGINNENQTFYIDVTLSDLNKVNGLPISYTLETSSQVLKISDLNFGEKYQKIIEVIEAPPLNAGNTKLVMDSSPVIKFDGSTYQINSNPVEEVLTTKIMGIATGKVEAGAEVEVEIAGDIYTTSLNTDKTFSLTIKSTDLLTSETLKVKATLPIEDLSNESISVSDEFNFVALPIFDSSMVSWSGKLLDYHKLPYFIQALDIETFQSDFFFGYLKDHPHGNESGPHTISYYFANTHEALNYSSFQNELINPIFYTDTNKSIVISNLQILEKYIDVDFIQVDSINDADITYYMSDINNGDTLLHDTYSNGYATYGGDVVFSAEVFGDNAESKGSLNSSTGISAVFHETMHSLGAKHPFEIGMGSLKLDTTVDSNGVTLMSYNKSNDFNESPDIRIYDLAYLQYRFGVNPDQRAGDDIYTFKTFNQSTVDGDIYIWDGSGTDTFDASQEQQGVYVNLTPGSDIYNDKNNTEQALFAVQGELINSAEQYFPDAIDKQESYLVVEKVENSNSYTVHTQIPTIYDFTEGHSFIGYGTQIENLTGSAFDDILIGNKANNLIYGGAGDDIIHGGEGHNYLDGGQGDDVYLIKESSNTIIEYDYNGEDIVFSSAQSYKLDYNVEHLVLTENAISGIGNDLDNNIVGNQLDNVLQGKIGNDNLVTIGGNDILTGGSGSDTFVIRDILDNTSATIADFNQDEGDIIQLNIEVFNSLNPSDLSSISQFINYDSSTGELSYDNDGLSTTDAIHFATISKDLQFDESWFSVV